MTLSVSISPHGLLLLDESSEHATPDVSMPAALVKRIVSAFADGPAAGLAHLATRELQTQLPTELSFLRGFARDYFTELCHTQRVDSDAEVESIAVPNVDALTTRTLHAPPMRGLEYLTPGVLADWWEQLDCHVRSEIQSCPGGIQSYLHDKNPLWRTVGQVTFHLAENKRDEQNPFAFMATYTNRVSAAGKLLHQPLAKALQEYAGANNRAAMVKLLTPISEASKRLEWVKELVETNSIYKPLAWSPQDAHRYLQDIPSLEESGLVVRVPDWWNRKSPPRPRVSGNLESNTTSVVGMAALLSFSINVSLGGEPLTDDEIEQILESDGGLIQLRGRWTEVDPDKLSEALDHWRYVEAAVNQDGISFLEGMRLLAGVSLSKSDASAQIESVKEWSGITAGPQLAQMLAQLRHPDSTTQASPKGLHAELRPYQQVGVNWLKFTTQLGLGACLADDMGLGKTIQVIALLLHLHRADGRRKKMSVQPSLLVVPASLIANWHSEIAKFAPDLKVFIAHRSETDVDFRSDDELASAIDGHDVVITTYGMITRLDSLRSRDWNLVVLDEAQAIKSATTRQTKAVKQLNGVARIALTGTPVENRLGDLWSLFDFLNPGLLGDSATFKRFTKSLAKASSAAYAPLRSLVQPYILRRLKTDKRIIADLPEKTEVATYCGLTKPQAALYEQSVRELKSTLEEVDGIKRRGIVLSYLMRFKQICNHPSQWKGDSEWDAKHSAKFQRLAALCEELADRQEKVLIFTQFREITDTLSTFLESIFRQSGLVLHGGAAVAKRKKMVESFQRDDGPPFFILSLKAGGTGLNLTAACHVVHFDRWWNPAVENQATDRAFRIGQKKNVMVHKFICRGTIEERIDMMITEKQAIADNVLDEGTDQLLTEMSDDQLLSFVALDINKAMDA